MFENDFEKMLKTYPEAVKERRKVSALLRDMFPGQQMQINLLCIAYDLGITKELDTVGQIGNAFAFRFVKRMVDEYGVSRLNADWAISIWCVCYGQKVLHKPCEIKISKAKTGAPPAIQDESASTSGKQYGDLFTYTRLNNGYGVTGFTGANKRTLIFSPYYQGQPVKQIMDKAFMESDVQEAVMVDGVEQIGASAFCGCMQLKQVIFPNTLREICDAAFSGCSALVTATLPQGVEQIGRYSFASTSIKSLSIPTSVYWIGEGAYSNCKRLDNIVLPENIISIPDKMFMGCDGIKSVKLPESIDSIGTEAFSGCAELQNLAIPQAVRSIGEDAFAGVHPNFTLLCHRLSVAEQYARSRGIKYQIIY